MSTIDDDMRRLPIEGITHCIKRFQLSQRVGDMQQGTIPIMSGAFMQQGWRYV